MPEKVPKSEKIADLAKKRAEKRPNERVGNRRDTPFTGIEGVAPELITKLREKAEKIINSASESARYSGAAHINQMVDDKHPRELLGEMEQLVPSPEGTPQTAYEVELAMAFLIVTDDGSEK